MAKYNGDKAFVAANLKQINFHYLIVLLLLHRYWRRTDGEARNYVQGRIIYIVKCNIFISVI